MLALGLGSNLGDRAAQLKRAVAALRQIFSHMRCSPVYECPALLPEGAPLDWNVPYLNMAVCGETTLAPHDVLAEVKAIEKALGRLPRAHWGPREIDIDILAYDDFIIHEPLLTIPHAQLLRRDFALIPFADIAPHWVHPGGKTAGELAGGMASTLRLTDIAIS